MYSSADRRQTPTSPPTHNQHNSNSNNYPPPSSSHNRAGSYTGVPPSPNHYHSQPASPSSTRAHPPPQSPTSRDRPTSSYYDPTSEARAGTREHSVTSTPYHLRSPVQHRESPFNNHDQLPPPPPPPPFTNGAPMESRPGSIYGPPSQSSPPSHAHAHPPPAAHSPPAPYDPVRANGNHTNLDFTSSQPAPVRRSNPMAMTNLLSEGVASSVPDSQPAPPPKASSPSSNNIVKPPSRKASRTSSITQSQPRLKQEPVETTRPLAPPAVVASPAAAPPARSVPPAQMGPPTLTIRDTERAWAEIQAADLSDVEVDVVGLERPKQDYINYNNKRTLELEAAESMKRKRRRLNLMDKLHTHFDSAADAERQAFLDVHENEVAEEVRLKEIEEDKERKKDQQRKRRREKAIADELIKREEFVQKLAATDDDEEKAKIEKEIQRIDKKVRDTQSRLQGITPSKEMRHESPHNNAAALGRREREVAMEGGLMTSFYSTNSMNDDGTPEFAAAGGRGRARGAGARGGTGARARKSKEQKQAEKDNAARGQAYLDQGQDLPALAPKDEERLLGYVDRRRLDREDSEGLSDIAPSAFDMQPTAGLTGMSKFESKGYNQIYEQISRDLAKNVPKVARLKNNNLDTKQSNARKTAQLAAKEARRWQLRTNKSTKDVAARAKRAMREMLGFWKRNERDEREGRKVAEKQELDKAKRAEAEREANRQKRKLNFLISQTELYSHFIGKKVKTDEIEKSGVDGEEGVAPTAEVIDGDVKMAEGKGLAKVTNFEDLDFDNEDETALREAAAANAQHAIQEAQDRARAFDKESGTELQGAQEDFDEGELNFQNPTSLQSMDVSQPRMLDCQLKEYQLKGLNWLVNLYEQGINGILADEMGLGKTVQSISVMAYLAEVHNIWGPFLVIAPASTLHNWQQEITRFVPDIKVLPYWGSAKDRKILRKFWDRKHITYSRDSPFHVLVTSYQLVVQDTAYFQKVKWQYMILDEAQAIKSSQSSRWKSLLGFHCRNRLLLTGTPIQNNMQELWALLHFIMPSLFDSHDEFSEWFSKDIENHAQSNTKLNEDQLRRLHMILKPFMLRRIKKHVQKELGDKIEEDVFCDLTYRQRAYYTNLRNKISILDLIEKAAVGDEQDTATLMNLVMQFRKVCNHPDLFERAETRSPLSCGTFAETASFMREGSFVNVAYSVRSAVEYWIPRLLVEGGGRLDVVGRDGRVGWKRRMLRGQLGVWGVENVRDGLGGRGAFSWLRFVGCSAGEVAELGRKGVFERAVEGLGMGGAEGLGRLGVVYDGDEEEGGGGRFTPVHEMLRIVDRRAKQPLADATTDGYLANLMNVSRASLARNGYDVIESCYLPTASAPPVELVCPSETALIEKETAYFNIPVRHALYPISLTTEAALLQAKLPTSKYPTTGLLPPPASQKQRFTNIQVPSMRRFVTDSGKLAKLDQLLRKLKEGGHRVLLYFQMTRMIDLMEEYLTYRNYKYCRLDGSTKLEDRRDTVAAFQGSDDIFIFLLSTRAGGLGINLTAADTVIFYDSDWNPTIDSQAMDRAHRLGQTRQVTVYRLITRGTIEERIRKRALQKEEVQRVVISGQAGSGKEVDFNNRGVGGGVGMRETNRTKEMAMWLADDDQAAAIERREREVLAEEEARGAGGVVMGGKRKRKAGAGGEKKGGVVSMDDMYHEGEGKFEDGLSHEASGAATPLSTVDGGLQAPMAAGGKKRKGMSKKAKTVRQRLAVVDGEVG